MRLSCKKGFTLIELLIVVVIIGVLVAVAVPMYSRHVTNAKLAEAPVMLNAIITYVKAYERAHGGLYPVPAENIGVEEAKWLYDIVPLKQDCNFTYTFVADVNGSSAEIYAMSNPGVVPGLVNILGYSFKGTRGTNTWFTIGDRMKDLKPS